MVPSIIFDSQVADSVQQIPPGNRGGIGRVERPRLRVCDSLETDPLPKREEKAPP
jgi:hypothetical protein